MADTAIAPSEAAQETVQSDVLKRIDKLPSLSSAVFEFLELAKQEYVTAKDFEKVLCKDQALVARLLKIANSGMFSGNRTVESIADAVVLIGMDNMKKMVYAVSSEGLLRQELKCYLYPDKGFWLHSMGCANICRSLADNAKNCELSGEEAFVAGLIHDSGKLIIDDFLDSAEGTREVPLSEEVTACGMDHSELAEHILKQWKLPEAIAQAVRHHHNPGEGQECYRGAAVIHLADAVCNTWQVGKAQLWNLGAEVDPAAYLEIMEAIGLPAERLPQILMDARQNLAKLEDLYGEDDDDD